MGVRWLFGALVVIHGLFPCSAAGQSVEVFDLQGGFLPSNTVRAICHDSIGGTWVGTDWGLCHFDGSVWETFQAGGSGLPENDIRALACDSLGRIWVGLFTQGVVIKDGNNWTQYMPGSSGLPSDQIRNIVFDHERKAWICTTNGLAWTDLVEWRIYNDTDTSYNNLELPGVNIADIAVRNDGLVCIGTLNAGFVYLTDTLVRTYNTFNDLIPDNTALGVALDSQGERWTACPAGALMRYTAGYDDALFFQYSTVFSNIPTDALNDVVVDALDRKIIATQNVGLTIMEPDNSTFTTYGTGNSAWPDNEVLCVTVSPVGEIWAGTGNGGAVRLTGWNSVSAERVTDAHVQVYPVPFGAELHLSAPGSGLGSRWVLRDIAGREVAGGKLLSDDQWLEFGVPLSPGPYSLTIVGPDRSATILVVHS
ncbi:MAG: hypothetical protein IPJ76_14485 [Flavobacteriales bacterium]|nr:MAG: hypothetical protein IPJ76_14485 [Flavobacteriales bacterium]